jgi:hypothetical protein
VSEQGNPMIFHDTSCSCVRCDRSMPKVGDLVTVAFTEGAEPIHLIVTASEGDGETGRLSFLPDPTEDRTDPHA